MPSGILRRFGGTCQKLKIKASRSFESSGFNSLYVQHENPEVLHLIPYFLFLILLFYVSVFHVAL
jgi:hypothetical protein